VFNVWICGISSSFIDIPATVILVSVMFQLSSITGIGLKTLIWGVVFGANLGGNLTPLDSTNIVALGILKKEGIDVGWSEWIKTYAPIACVHLAIASLYVTLLSVML
jgi:Na+/H+ antiporter NhaD/arsenite permease-like protein